MMWTPVRQLRSLSSKINAAKCNMWTHIFQCRVLLDNYYGVWKKARSIRMTMAWHHVQWSAPSPSFLESCCTKTARASFPVTARLQLWHPVTPPVLTFVLSSGCNKQALKIAYLLASRIFYSVFFFFLTVITIPFFFFSPPLLYS